MPRMATPDMNKTVYLTDKLSGFTLGRKKSNNAEQICLETGWTDLLQQLVDLGNRNYLKNFSLKLDMEYPNETKMVDEL